MWSSVLLSLLLAASANARFVMYADEWHPTRPTNPKDRVGIDHVVLAFAMANATASFQPKVPVSTFRSEYPNAKIMIAVGGWGDDIGFYEASRTDASIKQFAADVATMLVNTGADGVDIDWEYPGGNGGDYRQVPNSAKTYQIDAFPVLLAAVRAAIGNKILSIAVPGKAGDMIAYTQENGPKIWRSVDFINVMSYDLMNRRDDVTRHHTSVVDSAATIERYLAIGAPPEKLNLGFAYYAKYFTIQGTCTANPPFGCPIVEAEDPVTGKDTLTSGAWTFETWHMKPVDASSLTFSNDGTCGPDKGTKCSSGCCSQYGNCGTSPEHCSGACQHAFGTGCTGPDVAGSWQSALAHGTTDEKAGGQYYLDSANSLFWTWDTPALISRKFDDIVRKYKLGGVMAWSLGEDSYDWSHIKAMADELAKGGFGSGEPSSHHSHPLIPAPGPEGPNTPDSTPLEQGPVDPKAPNVANAPAPSAKPAQNEEASTPQQKKPVEPILPPPNQNNPPPKSQSRKPKPSRKPLPKPSRKPRPKPPHKPTPIPQIHIHRPAQPAPSPAQLPSPALPAASKDLQPFSPEFLAAMQGAAPGRRRLRPRVTAKPSGKVDLNRKAARAPKKKRGKKGGL